MRGSPDASCPSHQKFTGHSLFRDNLERQASGLARERHGGLTVLSPFFFEGV